MTRSDLIVVLLALIAMPFVYLHFWQAREPGQFGHIQIGNTLPQVIDLHRDQTISVTGTFGPSVLQVKNRRIRFVNSPCQQKYCIHSGWLSQQGELAACLPNGISVSIHGGKTVFDAINF